MKNIMTDRPNVALDFVIKSLNYLCKLQEKIELDLDKAYEYWRSTQTPDSFDLYNKFIDQAADVQEELAKYNQLRVQWLDYIEELRQRI